MRRNRKKIKHLVKPYKERLDSYTGIQENREFRRWLILINAGRSVFVCILIIQFLVKTTIATVTSTVEYLLGCSKYVYQLKIHLCFVDYRSIRKGFVLFFVS
jgi:hypothetical protein